MSKDSGGSVGDAKRYTLTEFVKLLREVSRYEIPTVASLLGLHKTTLYKWLDGETMGVPISTLRKKAGVLKDKFGVNITDLSSDSISAEMIEHHVSDISPLHSNCERHDEYVSELEDQVNKLTLENLQLKAELRRKNQ